MASTELHDLAADMLDECDSTGQAARAISELEHREPLRALIRQVARGRDMRVRTAVIDAAVVVARVDADIWNDDAATMRRKLTPRG